MIIDALDPGAEIPEDRVCAVAVEPAADAGEESVLRAASDRAGSAR